MNVQCYSIGIGKKFTSFDEAKRIHKQVYQYLLRLKNSSILYNHISFLIGVSETDKDSAEVCYVYNLKKGRPRRIIVGKKIGIHIHVYVFSTDNSASKFSHIAQKYFKKNYNSKVFLSKNDNFDVAISYIEKQSKPLWGHPHFKSKENFINSLY